MSIMHRSLTEDSAWKDKILDYEIETGWCWSITPPTPTWKDKILDYEIETGLFEAFQ